MVHFRYAQIETIKTYNLPMSYIAILPCFKVKAIVGSGGSRGSRGSGSCGVGSRGSSGGSGGFGSRALHFSTFQPY